MSYRQKNCIDDGLNIGDGNHSDAQQDVIGVLAPGVAANTYLIDSNTIIRQSDPNLVFPD